MFDGPRRSLHGSGREGCLPMSRIDHAVDSGGLGSSEQCPEVLRILKRIEHKNERGLLPLDGSGQDVVEAGKLALVSDQGNALMTVEAGE